MNNEQKNNTENQMKPKADSLTKFNSIDGPLAGLIKKKKREQTNYRYQD